MAVIKPDSKRRVGVLLIIEGILTLIGFGLFGLVARGLEVASILGVAVWAFFTFWCSLIVSGEVWRALEWRVLGESASKFLVSPMIKIFPYLSIPFMVLLYWIAPVSLILFALLFLSPGIWLIISEVLILAEVTPRPEGARAAPPQRQPPTEVPLVLSPEAVAITTRKLLHHIAQYRSVLGIFILFLVAVLVLWFAGVPALYLVIGASSALGIGYAVRKWKYKIALPARPEFRPHVETPFITVSCFVCLGTIKKGLPTVKCEGCSKMYHETCAIRVETCPNCSKSLKGIQPTPWVPERVSAPSVPPAPKRANWMCVILAVLVVIFLGAALFAPWWTLKEDEGALGKQTTTYMLQECNVKTENSSGTFENTLKYSDYRNNQTLDDTIRVYDTTFYLTVAAFIMAIFSLLGLYVASFKKASAKIGVAFLLGTMILVLGTFVRFAIALPSAINADMPGWEKGFWGAESVANIKLSWGPGYGWYLAIAAFALALVNLMIMIISKKKHPSILSSS